MSNGIIDLRDNIYFRCYGDGFYKYIDNPKLANDMKIF